MYVCSFEMSTETYVLLWRNMDKHLLIYHQIHSLSVYVSALLESKCKTLLRAHREIRVDAKSVLGFS